MKSWVFLWRIVFSATGTLSIGLCKMTYPYANHARLNIMSIICHPRWNGLSEATRMSKGPESKFKDKIRPYLKSLKNTWFCKVQQVGISGTPDFIMCIVGVFVALELKKDASSEPTELQKYMLRKIRESGGIGLVAFPENWQIIHHYLDKLANTGLTKSDIEVLHATNPLS